MSWQPNPCCAHSYDCDIGCYASICETKVTSVCLSVHQLHFALIGYRRYDIMSFCASVICVVKPCGGYAAGYIEQCRSVNEP